MDDKHKGCERGFTILSESWYRRQAVEPGTLDEIIVGMYDPDGGSSGEFLIRWLMVAYELTPFLKAFNDSWYALQKFGDLLTWMGSIDNQRITPKEFAEKLRTMGINDLTKRVRAR